MDALRAEKQWLESPVFIPSSADSIPGLFQSPGQDGVSSKEVPPASVSDWGPCGPAEGDWLLESKPSPWCPAQQGQLLFLLPPPSRGKEEPLDAVFSTFFQLLAAQHIPAPTFDLGSSFDHSGGWGGSNSGWS